MVSSGGAAFKDLNPFKSRMAGDAFESNDSVVKGAKQLLKAGSTSFIDGSDQQQASAEVSDEKADSFGVKGDSADAIESMPRTQDSGMSAKEEGFRNSNERRLGTQEYNRLAGSGIQDADKGGRYTGREVIAEMRDGRNGRTTEEMAAHYQSLADSGTKFNDKAQEFLSKHHGVQFNKPKAEPVDPKPVDEETPAEPVGPGTGSEGGADDTQEQQAQQLADRFKYEVGNFTHKPQDYQAIGNDIADNAIRRADERMLPELVELQKSVDRNPLYWKARSDVQTGDYLGDIWNFDIPDFKMPKPLDSVEGPDIGGIADKYMDKIDSIKPKL